MKLKCFECTDSNGIEQYLIPLENGSFIAIPKERISCLIMEQGIDCENYPRRFTCHEQPIIGLKRGEWILECDAEGEGDNLYRCPYCGEKVGCEEYDKPNFCPNCGADMRKSNQ